MRAWVIAVAILLFSATVVPAGAEDSPTYNEDVGSILLDNCASCHRPNQVAPMPLLSYQGRPPLGPCHQSQGAGPRDAAVVC